MIITKFPEIIWFFFCKRQTYFNIIHDMFIVLQASPYALGGVVNGERSNTQTGCHSYSKYGNGDTDSNPNCMAD